MMKKLSSTLFTFVLIGIIYVLALKAPSFTSFSGFPKGFCAECNVLIENEFLQFEQKRFHPSHFYCEHCSLSIKSSFEVEKGNPYHLVCLKKKQQVTCAHCHQELLQHFTEKEGEVYHPNCFEKIGQLACEHCKKPLSGKYYIQKQKNYHPRCFQDYIAPKCVVCQKAIIGNYLKGYWNSFHKHHNDIPQCSNCQRKIVDGGKTLADQRQICGICVKTMITEQKQVLQIQKEIRKQLKEFGVPIQLAKLPITLVTRPILKKKAKFIYTPKLQGLTVSRVETKENKRNLQAHIYILTGLEESLFRSVLIHEFMHVWVKENRQVPLDRQIEEGFANYLSVLLLQKQNNEMSRYLLFVHKNNKDPIYGEGLLKVTQMVRKRGFPNFIQQIRKNKLFR